MKNPIKVKRRNDSIAKVTLSIAFDTKSTPPEQQEAFWEVLGKMLAVLMPRQDQREKFLEQLRHELGGLNLVAPAPAGRQTRKKKASNGVAR